MRDGGARATDERLSRRRFLGVSAATAIGATATVAADARPGKRDAWPSFRNGLELRGVATGRLPEQLELRWKVRTPDGMVFTAAPAIVDGRVYAGTLAGELLCLELETGRLIWKYHSAPKPKPDTFIPGFPAAASVGESTVFIGDEFGTFHAVNRKTGKRRWVFKTGAEINSSAAILGDRVVFGSFDSNLYCLKNDNGTKLWAFQTADRINGSPAVAGKVTFVTGCDQHLRIIDVENGKQEHNMPLGSFLIASPAVVGDMLYVGTHGGEFLAIDWKQHKVVWRYSDPQRLFPIQASAAVHGDRVVVGGHDKRVHCLDRKTGQPVWVFSTRARVNSSPVIVDNRVFFGSNDQHVYGLDLGSGKEVFKFRGGADFTAAPAVAEGCLVIGSEGSQASLYCFGKK